MPGHRADCGVRGKVFVDHPDHPAWLRRPLYSLHPVPDKWCSQFIDDTERLADLLSEGYRLFRMRLVQDCIHLIALFLGQLRFFAHLVLQLDPQFNDDLPKASYSIGDAVSRQNLQRYGSDLALRQAPAQTVESLDGAAMPGSLIGFVRLWRVGLYQGSE